MNPNVTFFISELARTIMMVSYCCYYYFVHFGIGTELAAKFGGCL